MIATSNPAGVRSVARPQANIQGSRETQRHLPEKSGALPRRPFRHGPRGQTRQHTPISRRTELSVSWLPAGVITLYLRHIGLTLPACYADVASDVLIHYTDDTQIHTWVASHILLTSRIEEIRPRPASFCRHAGSERDLLKNRALSPELWQRESAAIVFDPGTGTASSSARTSPSSASSRRPTSVPCCAKSSRPGSPGSSRCKARWCTVSSCGS